MKAETFIKSGKRLIKRWLPRSSRLLSAHQLQRRQARAVSGFPPYGATYKAAGFTIEAGTVTTIPVTVTNRGTLTWEANSTFRLAYHWYQGSTLVMFEGRRTPLPTSVPTNGSLTLQATVEAPATPGTYTLKWDMVHEGITWLSWKGVQTEGQTGTVR